VKAEILTIAGVKTAGQIQNPHGKKMQEHED
jgi:hypothetical protein